MTIRTFMRSALTTAIVLSATVAVICRYQPPAGAFAFANQPARYIKMDGVRFSVPPGWRIVDGRRFGLCQFGSPTIAVGSPNVDEVCSGFRGNAGPTIRVIPLGKPVLELRSTSTTTVTGLRLRIVFMTGQPSVYSVLRFPFPSEPNSIRGLPDWGLLARFGGTRVQVAATAKDTADRDSIIRFVESATLLSRPKH